MTATARSMRRSAWPPTAAPAPATSPSPSAHCRDEARLRVARDEVLEQAAGLGDDALREPADQRVELVGREVAVVLVDPRPGAEAGRVELRVELGAVHVLP